MSDRLAIVRASHVTSYIAAMRKSGISVDRELARSRLPPRAEEMPDLFVSLPLALEWIGRCGSDLHPMQLGFLAAQEFSLASLKASHIGAIVCAPTCLKRLQITAAMVHREDSALRLTLQFEPAGLRVYCDFAQMKGHPYLCLADWLAVQGVISVVRSIAGQCWNPAEIRFTSTLPVWDAAREAFGTTRMIAGQMRTSVLIQSEVLGQTRSPQDSRVTIPPTSAADVDPWSFVTLLKSAIQPYLNGGHPDLELAAEIVGMSRRTLQRRLQICGQSYSEILQAARCDLARSLLHSTDTKIIEVAMMTGYETPQHFSRAFRRVTGLTPSAYRRTSVAQR